jgi:hypothetical protein
MRPMTDEENKMLELIRMECSTLIERIEKCKRGEEQIMQVIGGMGCLHAELEYVGEKLERKADATARWIAGTKWLN